MTRCILRLAGEGGDGVKPPDESADKPPEAASVDVEMKDETADTPAAVAKSFKCDE